MFSPVTRATKGDLPRWHPLQTDALLALDHGGREISELDFADRTRMLATLKSLYPYVRRSLNTTLTGYVYSLSDTGRRVLADLRALREDGMPSR
jgi:hypothetical protein